MEKRPVISRKKPFLVAFFNELFEIFGKGLNGRTAGASAIVLGLLYEFFSGSLGAFAFVGGLFFIVIALMSGSYVREADRLKAELDSERRGKRELEKKFHDEKFKLIHENHRLKKGEKLPLDDD